MDSVNYDTIINTPLECIPKLGKIEKVYSQACWTAPSMLGYLYIPFFIGGKPLVKIGKKTIPMRLPIWFKEKGYFTSLISDQAWFEVGKNLFSEGFDTYEVLPMTLNSEIDIFNSASKLLSNNPFFMLLFLVNTHRKGHTHGKFLAYQQKKLMDIDKAFKDFYQHIPSNTNITITSDHGHVMSIAKGHDPQCISFTKEVFEIFVVYIEK